MQRILQQIQSALTRLFAIQPFGVWALFVVTLVGVEYVDYITGPELDVCFLLTLPIFLVAWRFGWLMGILSSLISSVAALQVQFLENVVYTHPIVAWLNTITLFLYLAIFGSLVHALRLEMERRMQLARTDSLTGLLNRRAFDDLLQNEMYRLIRFKRAFTLLYFDLDRFKWVNDTKGHRAGDELLKGVARVVLGSVRETDVVGRIGGDEFAVLLSETGEEAAKSAASNLEANLAGLFLGTGYPVSASFGWVTCSKPHTSIVALWEDVDKRMYREKSRHKSGGAETIQTPVALHVIPK
jgi:diguanylate cyclase (GGDEF)-like protein